MQHIEKCAFPIQHVCGPVPKARIMQTWLDEFSVEEVNWTNQNPDNNHHRAPLGWTGTKVTSQTSSSISAWQNLFKIPPSVSVLFMANHGREARERLHFHNNFLEELLFTQTQKKWKICKLFLLYFFAFLIKFFCCCLILNHKEKKITETVCLELLALLLSRNHVLIFPVFQAQMCYILMNIFCKF